MGKETTQIIEGYYLDEENKEFPGVQPYSCLESLGFVTLVDLRCEDPVGSGDHQDV